MERILYYYNAGVDAVAYSVSRVKDGYIWDTTANEGVGGYVAPDTVSFADALIDADAVAALGAWDIKMPNPTDTFAQMGQYQIAIYAASDSGTASTAVTPDVGVVVEQQATGSVTILDMK